jgi:uncharacterized protein (TIGR02611 family)
MTRFQGWMRRLAALDADGRHASRSYRLARRIAVAVIGSSLLLAGVAMLVLPGPGWAGVALGLAVLGLEFAWARRWLAQVRKHGSRALEALLRRRRENGSDAAAPTRRGPGNPT